ncbi:unnamed protein product [Polarella glacialis]|uniref:Alpha-type protein kinase domain-containing protein n=1 Tax=Polarella glacialis TaxID=89957 RepID=A0A813HVB1_POLGL|nr:unnamed protein product [Polarella glacialis]CAE8641268.1 unnamed protein product [Polarella glacialis]
MQALSHYSYEANDRKMLLCDSQGVERDDIFILTDPVICSADHQFGATHLGPHGSTTSLLTTSAANSVEVTGAGHGSRRCTSLRFVAPPSPVPVRWRGSSSLELD